MCAISISDWVLFETDFTYVVLYGYSGGTQTLDIDARARGNGEHSNGNEHPGEFERVYGRTKS